MIVRLRGQRHICPRALLEIKAACLSEAHELADLYRFSLQVAKDHPNNAISHYTKALHALLRGDKSLARKLLTYPLPCRIPQC